MATWDDVRVLALGLPEVEEGVSRGTAVWRCGKLVVWDRPLRQRDRDELGANAPDGPILGAAVADEGEKHALVAAEPGIFFTTAHFAGYPSVLVQLDHISRARLAEVVTDAWLAVAPRRLTAAWSSGVNLGPSGGGGRNPEPRLMTAAGKGDGDPAADSE